MREQFGQWIVSEEKYQVPSTAMGVPLPPKLQLLDTY
jgi:hypothetical protein